MRIVSFMKEPQEIKGIMKAQGIAEFRAPPKIPHSSNEQLFFDDIPDYNA